MLIYLPLPVDAPRSVQSFTEWAGSAKFAENAQQLSHVVGGQERGEMFDDRASIDRPHPLLHLSTLRGNTQILAAGIVVNRFAYELQH